MSVLSSLNPLNRISGSGTPLDLSQLDPTKYKLHNGELYTWQPDTSGDANLAGSGAAYDSNVDLGGAERNSGGGTWVKADPNKDPTLRHILGGFLGATAQTGAYAAAANTLQGLAGGAAGGGFNAAGNAGYNAAAGGGSGASIAAGGVAGAGQIGTGAGSSAAAGGGTLSKIASGLKGVSGKDWLNLGLGTADSIASHLQQSSAQNQNAAQNAAALALDREKLAQQQAQFEAEQKQLQGQFDAGQQQKKSEQTGFFQTQDPLAQQRSRQKNALLSSLMGHYSPTQYHPENQTFSGGANDLTEVLKDPTLAALFSQAAAQGAENQFTSNAKAASGGQYAGPEYASVYGGAAPTPPPTTTQMPGVPNALDAKKRLLAGLL